MKTVFRIIAVATLTAATVLAGSLLEAKGKRVVFIGDSITDGNWGAGYKPTCAERNQTDMNHIYGHGFMEMIASEFQSKRPKAEYEFFNRGISGHKLSDLERRWKEDVLDLNPDVVSVLIGINDVGQYFNDKSKDKAPFDFDNWKERYRSLLIQVKERNPSVKLVLCAPFIAKEGSVGRSADYGAREEMTENLALIVRELSDEVGATLVPFDTLLGKLVESEPKPCYWIWDGIHPTPAGHRRMADLWMRKVKI